MKIYDITQFEKLNINQINIDDLSSIKKSNFIEYKEFPIDTKELKSIIKMRIAKEGPYCDLNNIDVSSITDMSYLFEDSEFNGDISRWDVSNVEYMVCMFRNAKNFNNDISNWDVFNVKDMSSMFVYARLFNQDISKWNVSNVTNMSYMFLSATKFNQNISKWNVSNVKKMEYMFYYAKSFNQDISKWNVSNVVTKKCMFNYCKLEKQQNKQPKFIY